MLNKCLSYLLLSLIAMQSVAAVADRHQFERSSNTHIASRYIAISGSSFLDNPLRDITPSVRSVVSVSNSNSDVHSDVNQGLNVHNSESNVIGLDASGASDCNHCCHCHGTLHVYLDADMEIVAPRLLNNQVSFYHSSYFAVVVDPAFRPPIYTL